MSARTLLIGGTSPLGNAVQKVLQAQHRDNTSLAAPLRTGDQHLDVMDADSITRWFEEPWDQVIYLSDPGPLSDQSMSELHSAGLRAVAERAREGGVRRLVFASSAAVYGTRDEGVLRESSALSGSSTYARRKIEGERILASAADDHLSVVALRIFNLYGPDLPRSLVTRLLAPGEKPQMRLSPNFVRDYIHVEDVATAIWRALGASRPAFTAINVGTGVGTSNTTLAELAGPKAYEPERSVERSVSVADTTAAEQLLGFRHSRRLEDAFAVVRTDSPPSLSPKR